MPYRSPADWEHWSAERIREEQGRKLQRFLREQVLAFSPYYRRLFREHGIDPASIRRVEDLRKIPFTTKSDIAPTSDLPDRPRDFVLQPTPELIRAHWGLGRKLPLLFRKMFHGQRAVMDHLAAEYRPVSVFFTTGRSALPTAFALSRYDLDVLEEVGSRMLQVAAVDPTEDRLLNIFPFAPHLAFWQVYYAGVGATAFTLNTGGGKVMGTVPILQAMAKIRPAYIIGIPGYMYHLLREAHSRSMDLSFLKGMALGGDQVTPNYRTRVKAMLESLGATNPRVVSVLGFTEARKCWSECVGEANSGFHTYPDLEIVELVDPDTGDPVGEHETGELVYTCLDGRGSCVLRYRTGDLIIGGMSLEACPHCGRTVPRLASHLERVSNVKHFQLSKVKGTLVNLNALKNELESHELIEEWQLVIRKRGNDPFDIDELILNVALSGNVASGNVASGAVSKQQAIDRIGECVQLASEVRLNEIKVLPLDQVLELLGMETQLKEKRIVDLRPSAQEAQSGAAAAKVAP